MNTQTQAIKTDPIQDLCGQLLSDAFKKDLQQALPPNLSVDKFCRTAINAIMTHQQQDKFNKCDPRTLFISCQKAAADGLVLDGREATLVAFWNKKKQLNDINYIPMAQGLVKVARNTGEIEDFDAQVVYMNDPFEFEPGIDTRPKFKPDWKTAPSKRGEPVLAFCVIKLKSGTLISPPPMHCERIMEIANQGNNADQYDPKKGKNWGEWWRKTVIKNALKYAPKSPELVTVEKNINDGEGFDFARDITPKNFSAITNLLNKQSDNQIAQQEPESKEEPTQAPTPEPKSKNQTNEPKQKAPPTNNIDQDQIYKNYAEAIDAANYDDMQELGRQIGEEKRLSEEQVELLRDSYMLKMSEFKQQIQQDNHSGQDNQT